MPCKRGKRAIIMLAFALAACQPQSLSVSPTAETVVLRLQSTQSTTSLLQELAAGYQGEHPTIRLALWLSTSSSYETMVAGASRTASGGPIYAVTQFLAPESPLWAAPIARDQIAIITSLDSSIPGISSADLRAIFQGRITNWAALGGPDQPVIVISREPASTDAYAFQALIMNARPITRDAQLAPSAEAMRQIVGQTPGAIGYLFLSKADASVRILAVDGLLPTHDTQSTYPFASTILIIGPGEPEGAYRDFFAWIQSPAGQRIIARYYTSLTP